MDGALLNTKFLKQRARNGGAVEGDGQSWAPPSICNLSQPPGRSGCTDQGERGALRVSALTLWHSYNGPKFYIAVEHAALYLEADD